MKIKISAGFGNGTRGGCVVDTKEFPREYHICHGALAIRLEAVVEELPAQPTPQEVVKEHGRADKRQGGRF